MNDLKFIRESAVRTVLKTIKGGENMRISKEFFGALNDEVVHLIARAVDRASDNNRKTLRGHDV